VLDGAHPGPQRRHDARLAVAVRRDDPVGEPRDLDDGPQLRHRELLVDRVVDLGQHAAGRAHLDHPRVAPQLLADRLGALIGPSASRSMPSCLAKSSIQSSGKACRSPCPPVVLRIAPAP
jgi:hypothetical protein